MDNLQLQNYRCFSDTGKVHFSPLTFLLGRNSTGKSSLLKILPLFNQTVGKYVNGAFLWYGENVDLGNFKNVLKEGADKLSMSFEIPDSEIDIRRGVIQQKTGTSIKCVFQLHSIDEKVEYFSSIHIQSSKYNFICKFNNILINELVVGKVSSSQFPNERLFSLGTNSIVPKVLFTDEPWDFSQAAQSEIDKILSENGVNSMVERRMSITFDTKSRAIKALENEGLSKENAERIYDLQVYSKANDIIDAVNRYLIVLANRVYYTKPLRAMGERFYRYRNVAVDRVDPSGENLAMYLSNLSDEGLGDLNQYLDSNFHFTVNIKGEGNLEILITTEDGERNLVDMGFGFTQILPILITIWDVKYRISHSHRERSKTIKKQVPYFLLIEQPELHLHPKLQFDFARVISSLVTDSIENDIDLRLIIETHSEYIINKIGELIAQGNLDQELVSVLLFNKPDEGEQIVRSVFSNDGYLTNWPYGFFDE